MQKRGRPSNSARAAQHNEALISAIAAEVARQLQSGQSEVKVAAVAAPKAPKATTALTMIELRPIARPNKTTTTDKFEVVSGGYGTLYLPKGVNIANVRLTR